MPKINPFFVLSTNSNTNNNGNDNGNENQANQVNNIKGRTQNNLIKNNSNNSFTVVSSKKKTKKGSHQSSEQKLYRRLTELQNRISDNLDWKSQVNGKKDIFFLNRRIKEGDKLDVEQENFQRYWEFLQFCDKSIEEFKKIPLTQKSQQSYSLEKLSREDREEFAKIAAEYDRYSFPQVSPTNRNLLEINEEIIDAKTRNKYFDKMRPEEIFEILEERVEGLLHCSTQSTKSEDFKKYYREEYIREKGFLESGKDLTEIADLINWDPDEFFADFSSEKLNEIYEAIQGDPEKIKKLATFLPLNIFDYPEDLLTIKLKKDEFIKFMLANGKTKKNCQQLVLGFGKELDANFYKQQKYYQLYHILLLIDLKFSCHHLCDYSILLNLFYMYMMSISETKVFPIMFKMPKDKYAYDSTNQTYNFRKVPPHPANILFGKHRDFLGMHLFKYIENGKVKIMCIFTFKNNEFDKDAIYDQIFSYYSGKELKYFNTDFFLDRIESGEIKCNMGITHQEFYDLFKYYKLTPFIMDNKTDELFATRRRVGDPELDRLIGLLNMRPVRIEKQKIEIHLPERFKITPIELSEINYETGSFVQLPPNISIVSKKTRKSSVKNSKPLNKSKSSVSHRRSSSRA